MPSLSLEDLISGLQHESGDQVCIICGTRFERGVIYRDRELYVDAARAAELHVESVHGGMLSVLLGLPKDVSGLSETQQTIVAALAAHRTDKDIARELGGRAASTVRNHRFQLRRRFMEAKVLTALSILMDSGSDPETDFISYHTDIPADDERVVTTRAEARAILAHYIHEDGGLRLTKFPKKEKEKLVLLKRITEEFDRTRRYSESEVNDVLRPIYDDYVTIRRYLIEYRFMDRVPGGAEYWVNA